MVVKYCASHFNLGDGSIINEPKKIYVVQNQNAYLVSDQIDIDITKMT